MATTVATSATGWIFWIIAAHRWSNSQVGVATSAVAFMTIIALVAAQPVATTLLARLPRSDHRLELLEASGLTATGLAVILSAIAIATPPHSLHDLRTVGVGSLFAIASIAASIGIILDNAAVAAQQPQQMVSRNLIQGIGKLVVLGAAVVFVTTITAPFAVMIAWASTTVVSIWWAVRARVRDERRRRSSREVPIEIERTRGWMQLRGGFGVQVIATLGGSIPPYILPLLVLSYLGSARASWFSITWFTGGLCYMISPAVSQALLADASHEPEKLLAKVRFATLISLGLLVLPIVIYVAAGRYVLDLFGHNYATYGTFLLAILAISAIPDLITNIGNSYFRAQDKIGSAAIVNSVIAVVTLVVAVVLIPRDGVDGAGWAWAAGEAVGCVALAGCLIAERISRSSSRRPRTTIS